MIIHKNVPSSDNMFDIVQNRNNEDIENDQNENKFKRTKRNQNTKHQDVQIEIINEPTDNSEKFRRVESTSSFKRLPKLSSIFEQVDENAEMSIEKTVYVNSSKNYDNNHINLNTINTIYNQNYQQ